jgi:hypothetical protein
MGKVLKHMCFTKLTRVCSLLQSRGFSGFVYDAPDPHSTIYKGVTLVVLSPWSVAGMSNDTLGEALNTKDPKKIDGTHNF